jgi:hypothetical protein
MLRLKNSRVLGASPNEGFLQECRKTFLQKLASVRTLAVLAGYEKPFVGTSSPFNFERRERRARRLDASFSAAMESSKIFIFSFWLQPLSVESIAVSSSFRNAFFKI